MWNEDLFLEISGGKKAQLKVTCKDASRLVVV